MANEDSVLREVDQELAEDRQWETFRKYGPGVIAGAVAILVVVAGSEFWNARKDAAAAQGAFEYKNAVELVNENIDDGRAALAAIAEEKNGGYSVLAKLQEAAIFIRSGERLSAVSAYKELADDSSAPKRIRELARLRAGYFSLPDGRDAVLESLDGVHEGEDQNALFGKEILGLAAIGEKDYETANAIFLELTRTIDAPADLRDRAEEFAALAAAGRAGVNITGETRLDDIVDMLGAETLGEVEIQAGDDGANLEAVDGESATNEAAQEDAGQGESGDQQTVADDTSNENEQ